MNRKANGVDPNQTAWIYRQIWIYTGLTWDRIHIDAPEGLKLVNSARVNVSFGETY